MNKIGIIGGGNLGVSLALGIIEGGNNKASNITISRRNISKIIHLQEKGLSITNNNEELLAKSQTIILAVLPQQFDQVISQIKPFVNPEKHIIVSLISGVTIENITQNLDQQLPIYRAMPNTAVAIRQSMTCIACNDLGNQTLPQLIELFKAVGEVISIREDLMTSATALCACGTAFFLRAIRAASQGGIEIGFHANEALKMAAQTAKGAAALLLEMEKHPEREIDKVTSPEGCTIAGLNEMEHQGFSSAMIKGITTSAKKARGLYTNN